MLEGASVDVGSASDVDATLEGAFVVSGSAEDDIIVDEAIVGMAVEVDMVLEADSKEVEVELEDPPTEVEVEFPATGASGEVALSEELDPVESTGPEGACEPVDGVPTGAAVELFDALVSPEVELSALVELVSPLVGTRGVEVEFEDPLVGASLDVELALEVELDPSEEDVEPLFGTPLDVELAAPVEVPSAVVLFESEVPVVDVVLEPCWESVVDPAVGVASLVELSSEVV